MKKKFLKVLACCLLLACLLASAVSVNAQTVPADVEDEPAACGTARVEDTEWIFRWQDGVLEKRLWSRTYGVWLTGWIKA